MLQDDLSSLELDQSKPVIYDRPIGLQLLYQDAESGAEHYLIRYPPNLRAQRHRHTAAHTIILLEGVMEAQRTAPAGRLLCPLRGLARSTTIPPPRVALVYS